MCEVKRVYKVDIDYSNHYEFESWVAAGRFIESALNHSTKNEPWIQISVRTVEEVNHESDAETDEA